MVHHRLERFVSHSHLQLNSGFLETRQRFFQAVLTSTEDAVLQILLLLDFFGVHIENHFLFGRKIFVHVLEVVGLEVPLTSREKLKNSEADKDFLLDSDQEARLEENQHQEVNEKGWDPLRQEQS